MKRASRAVLIGSILVSLSSLSFADEGDNDQGKKAKFIGVFTPVIQGVGIDTKRCPDPTHPFLLTFTGTAHTTLGSAQLAQSHCEDPEHTSFRRGLQTITFGDGTQLFGAYEGRLLATPTTGVDFQLIIDGRYRNTGGTGALANARGMGISAGTVDIRTGGAVVAVSGEL